MNDAPDTRSMVIRNGELLPADAPVVSMNDPAMIQGHGLFETIQAYQGHPFALSEHLDRLEGGCRILGLAAPSRRTVSASCQKIMEVNQLNSAANCRLRITIAAGREGPVEIYEATPSPVHPDLAEVITGPFVRNERSLLSGIKTLSYGENAVATGMTKKQGATEALWSNSREELCEGTWSNVFVRIDGQWMTPPLDSGCLPGITRLLILQMARDQGVKIDQKSIPMTDLQGVDSAFLTSSIREIQPIAVIDGRSLSSSLDEEIESLQRAYELLVETSAQNS